MRVKSSRVKEEEGKERKREEGGGNKEKDGTDRRQGEEGIKLRFNFAAISQARVARRDTPNIRRNLHFKLETSCDGLRVPLSAPTLTTKSSSWPRDCEFVRKIARAICASVLQMRGCRLWNYRKLLAEVETFFTSLCDSLDYGELDGSKYL